MMELEECRVCESLWVKISRPCRIAGSLTFSLLRPLVTEQQSRRFAEHPSDRAAASQFCQPTGAQLLTCRGGSESRDVRVTYWSLGAGTSFDSRTAV